MFTSELGTTFYSDDFTESNVFKINPDQGFYNPTIVTITTSSIKYDLHIPEQVYQLRCDISQFSKANNGYDDWELTETALTKLEELLNKIKSENKNLVIRFSYDSGYKGNSNKEASMTMIERHIQQLSVVLNKFYHTITAIEAGMLGPWGEMHTSKMATEENKAKVFKFWLQNTNNIPVLARTPKAIFTYFGKSLDQMEKTEIPEGDEGYHLGLYNDCYLSSNSDEGTYKIDRTREVNWLSKQNEHLPFGGETCAVHSMNNLENAIPEMYKLGLSYLNIEYNQDVISKWKSLTYDSSLGDDSIFYGMSGFDYIKAHMGYRLVIKSINIKYEAGSTFELVIKIDNKGYGNMIKEKMVDMICMNSANTIIRRVNLGKYKGENELTLKGELLPKDYDDYRVFIKIYGLKENNKDYYYVQFANDNIYNIQTNSNYLFKVVKGGEIQK